MTSQAVEDGFLEKQNPQAAGGEPDQTSTDARGLSFDFGSLLSQFNFSKMDRVILPPRLPEGGTIGLCALSSPLSICTAPSVQAALGFLGRKGFTLEEAPNLYQQEGVEVAGTPQERVNSVHRFFADPKIDAILSFWGGYQTNEILDLLDFDLIARNPKPLIGFSDTTALQNAIYAKTKLVTFSGAAAISFAHPTHPPTYTWESLRDVVMRGEEGLTFESSTWFSESAWWRNEDMLREVTVSKGWQGYRNGVVEGRLIGGNLQTLLRLAGTEYWPSCKDAILVLEEAIGAPSGRIFSSFAQLRQMGVFNQIQGLIVGRFGQRSQMTGASPILTDLLDKYLGDRDFPVLYDVDFGHTEPSLTLPIGGLVRLDATSKTIALAAPCVRSSEETTTARRTSQSPKL